MTLPRPLRYGYLTSTSAVSSSRTSRVRLCKRAGGILMKNFAGCRLLLVTAILIGSTNFAEAQNAGVGMAMPTNTLLVAQLDAKQVAGPSSSSATGTGAFLLDPVQHTLD